MKYRIVEINLKEFPEKLRSIKKSPQKLYGMGNLKLLNEECFAVVGTRKISKYGIRNCEAFTKELVLRQIPIVSGMAIGTDTIAHRTSLRYGGKTIAVLGSGLNNIFPKENEELFYEIIKNDGLIISEYESNIKPMKQNFPQRNRIITAISEGILVIEAAYRSGTSITAKNAKEQGKNVFAIPGKLDSPVGVGVNRLIKEGAILTTSIDDILERYPNFRERKRLNEKVIKSTINKEFKILYDFLNEGKYFDEILGNTDKTFQELVSQLSKMEIEGLIYQEIDGKYKRVSKEKNG